MPCSPRPKHCTTSREDHSLTAPPMSFPQEKTVAIPKVFPDRFSIAYSIACARHMSWQDLFLRRSTMLMVRCPPAPRRASSSPCCCLEINSLLSLLLNLPCILGSKTQIPPLMLGYWTHHHHTGKGTYGFWQTTLYQSCSHSQTAQR